MEPAEIGVAVVSRGWLRFRETGGWLVLLLSLPEQSNERRPLLSASLAYGRGMNGLQQLRCGRVLTACAAVVRRLARRRALTRCGLAPLA